MKNIISLLMMSAAILCCALPAQAQRQRLSPHETVSAVIGGDRVTITYGRPYTVKPGTTEVRKIWGGLVPYGQPWRLGADEATSLITQQPIEFGSTTISAGAYTLYMMPVESGTSQLVFSSHLGGWGIPVDTSHDVAKVDLTKSALDKTVDQFTMSVGKNTDGGGIIKFMWENTQFSAPFTVQK